MGDQSIRGCGFSRRQLLRTAAVTPLAAAAGKALGQVSGPGRPNIVLMHCHDLGQFLHCYGAGSVRTPNLDAFAAEGVRFGRSFCTAPQCSPSRASLFTGRYPHSTGVMGLCHANFAWDLNADEKHLGQYLKEAGYRTAGVGVIHETRSGPRRCGLEVYRPGARAAACVDEAIGLLGEFARERRRPFYLQMGTIEPHRLAKKDDPGDLGFVGDELEPDTALGVSVPPYLRDTEGTRVELAELQGAVHHVDKQFGRLRAALEKLGLEEDTLLIFTTDHGIAMPRAKCSLYDPGLQVALLLRLPRRAGWSGGVVREELIQNIDYTPSILDLLGLAVPGRIHGVSFAPLLDGKAYGRREAIFGEITYHDYYDPRRCIRTDTHKLIVNFSNAYFFMDPSQSWRPRSDTTVPVNPARAYHEVVELYDLRIDPWEQQNIAEEPAHAEIRADLLRRLLGHLRSTSDPILEGAVASPMSRAALAALGAV